MAKYTNEEILDILRNLSRQLGKDTLSKKDIAKAISPSTVTNRFGSLGDALEAAGLRKTDSRDQFRNRGQELSDEQLFAALHRVELEAGKEPGYNMCAAKCEYSVTPYRKRFGKWPDVLAHYRKWKQENGIYSSDGDSSGNRQQHPREESSRSASSTSQAVSFVETAKVRKPPAQFFGEPIDFRGLRNAPINEQGVVFLFGMVSAELGFSIESVQQGFPDCEGKYLHDAKRKLWVKARIEFEYKASSFKQHGHDSSQCDFIVCWVDDWPEYPIIFIELKKEILKLPNR